MTVNTPKSQTISSKGPISKKSWFWVSFPTRQFLWIGSRTCRRSQSVSVWRAGNDTLLLIQLQPNNSFFWRAQLLYNCNDVNFTFSPSTLRPHVTLCFIHWTLPSCTPGRKDLECFLASEYLILFKLTRWNRLPEKYFPLCLFQRLRLWPGTHPINSLWDPVTFSLAGISDGSNILPPFDEPSSG